MKAKAKHWVNYNGVWHPAGEEFPIDKADAESMKRYAEVTEDEPVTEAQEPEQSEPVRRGRKRKTEE